MNLLKKILCFFASPIFCLTLYAQTLSSFLNVNVGLQTFTFHSQGAVRLYYSDSSQITHVTYISPNNAQYATLDFTYNKQGLVASKALIELNKSFLSRISVFYYSYDKNNKLLSEMQYYGFSTRNLRYSYDLFNRLESIENYQGAFFASKKECLKNIYSLDNRLDMSSYYDQYGLLALQYEWKYDSLGRVSSKKLTGPLGMLWQSHYSYDQNFDTITTLDEKDNLLYKQLIYKNSSNQPLETHLLTSDGCLKLVTEYKYNDCNHLISLKETDDQKNLLGFQTIYYDTLDRPYLYEYNYVDASFAFERMKIALRLPGQDL